MAEQLKIVISADVVQAMGGLDKVKQNFRATADAGEKFGTTIARSTAVASTALQKLPGSANQATLAMTNLGRVVQDAPFGFLGIANNLNPLLESFQRLKQSTGTTGGALKALGGSLLGAGGLGFAISIVSSLLIVFGDRIFGMGKKAKEAKEALNELAKSVAEPIVKLTTLVGIIKNVNSSLDDKKKALQALNDQYGKYLDSLRSEEITLGNIDIAYNKIIDTLLRQAVVKGLQEEIAKEVEKTAKAMLAISLSQERERLAADKSISAKGRLINEQEQLNKKLQEGLQPVRDGFLLNAQANQTTKATIGLLNTNESALERLKAQLLETLKPLLNLTTNFEDLNQNLKQPLKLKVKPEIDFEELIRNILRQLHGAPGLGVPVVIEPVLNEKVIENFFSDLKRRIEPEQIDLSISPTLIKQFDAIQKKFSELGTKGVELFNKITAGLNIGDQIAVATEEFEKLKSQIFAANEFAGILSNSFASMFDAITEGKAPLKAFFDSMIQSINQVIKKLIQAAIQAAILSAITGGTAGSFGSIFKGLIGIGGQAGGGLTSLGGAISARSFGNTFSVIVNGRVSGDDIILAGGRALTSQGRIG